LRHRRPAPPHACLTAHRLEVLRTGWSARTAHGTADLPACLTAGPHLPFEHGTADLVQKPCTAVCK